MGTRGAVGFPHPRRHSLIVRKLLFLSLLASAAQAQQYTRTTFAGGGPPDGVPATSIGVGAWGIAMDASGNLYIAGGYLYRIFKVTPAGIATTIAGNGQQGFADGPATSGSFLEPSDVAVDGAGNVYIADLAGLRKVSPNGLLTTVHPKPSNQALMNASGVAADGSGNVYVADPSTNRIHKFTPDGIHSIFAGSSDLFGFGGDNGPATSARLSCPGGVAVDKSGNVFIADSCNQRIRKVTTAGIISTIAGNGQDGFAGDGGLATNARLGFPVRVAVDNAGNVYFSERDNRRVRKVDNAGTISTVAGGGTDAGDGIPAIHAALDYPAGLVTDAAGNLYIADSANDRIRKVTPDGRISTFAGGSNLGDGGSATSAQLKRPTGLSVDGSGNVLVGDLGHYRVRKISPASVISTLAGNGHGLYYQPNSSGSLYGPGGTAVDSRGNVFIADCTTVRKLTPDGALSVVAGTGEVGDSLGDNGPALNARLGCATLIAVDLFSNLFIATDGGSRLRKITPQEVISTVTGDGTYGFSGDGGPAASARVSGIAGLAVDRNGNVYIADKQNYRIRKITPGGIISTVAGGGPWGQTGDGIPATQADIGGPVGVVLDAFGNLFFGTASRIRRVSPDGTISTVIALGDRDPIVESLALDNAGNLFASSFDDNRVWKLAPTAQSPTVQPAAVSFSAATQNPPAQTLTVTNGAGAAAAVTNGDFLSVIPIPGGFSVAANTTGFAPGAYSGNIRVGGAGPNVDVPVALCVFSASSVFPQLNATGGEGSISIVTGAGCTWTLSTTATWITGGTSSNGSASRSIRIAANTGPARSAEITLTSNGAALSTFTIIQSGSSTSTNRGLHFVPVTPCRVTDTRNTTRLEAGETRTVAIPQSACTIPSAAAYSLNVTVVPAGSLSYLTLWPAAQLRPLVSTLNSFDGTIRANAAIVPSGLDGAISVFVTNPTDIILDINGYFIAPQ